MHLDITFRLLVVESSSLVSLIFREAFSQPYISFFHLLIKFLSVVIIINIFINFFRQVFTEYTDVVIRSLIGWSEVSPTLGC